MMRFLCGLLVLMLTASIGLAQDETGQEGGLKVEGKLTQDDAKDKVRSNSFHKVHTFKMEEGKSYQINLISNQFDPFLRLEDANGKQLAFDDDGGGFPNARLSFSPAKSGEYRVIVTSFDANKTGAYTLTARELTGPDADLEKLKAEYTKAEQEIVQRYQKTRDEKEKAKVLQEYQGLGAKFAPKALEFAEKHAKESAGSAAVEWLMQGLNYGEAARILYENTFKTDKDAAAKVYEKSVATLERIAKDHPKFKKMADDAVYLLSKLSIGKTAPEITGEDIDGVKFKLSDYRGKVVVVDFWGDW